MVIEKPKGSSCNSHPPAPGTLPLLPHIQTWVEEGRDLYSSVLWCSLKYVLWGSCCHSFWLASLLLPTSFSHASASVALPFLSAVWLAVTQVLCQQPSGVSWMGMVQQALHWMLMFGHLHSLKGLGRRLSSPQRTLNLWQAHNQHYIWTAFWWHQGYSLVKIPFAVIIGNISLCCHIPYLCVRVCAHMFFKKNYWEWSKCCGLVAVTMNAASSVGAGLCDG